MFFLMNSLMGYHNLLSWVDCWKTEPDLSVQFVPGIMSRTYFGQIIINLDANGNDMISATNEDKL